MMTLVLTIFFITRLIEFHYISYSSLFALFLLLNQEAAALAAAEVAFLLQAGQRRGIQVRIAQVPPSPTPVSNAAPVPAPTNEHAVTVPAS